MLNPKFGDILTFKTCSKCICIYLKSSIHGTGYVCLLRAYRCNIHYKMIFRNQATNIITTNHINRLCFYSVLSEEK